MSSLLPFAISEGNNQLPQNLYQRIQQQLLQFVQAHPGLGNLLVATADGFEVATILKEDNPDRIHKVAAMTSSIIGIGTAMLNEIGAGEQQALTLEGENEYILFHQIRTPQLTLCLTAIASREESLGQLFWLLRQLVRNITELCSEVIKPVLLEEDVHE